VTTAVTSLTWPFFWLFTNLTFLQNLTFKKKLDFFTKLEFFLQNLTINTKVRHFYKKNGLDNMTFLSTFQPETFFQGGGRPPGRRGPLHIHRGQLLGLQRLHLQEQCGGLQVLHVWRQKRWKGTFYKGIFTQSNIFGSDMTWHLMPYGIFVPYVQHKFT
jgi:hypothetical protein